MDVMNGSIITDNNAIRRTHYEQNATHFMGTSAVSHPQDYVADC
ncbi:unnamed protein product, partial [marine sediment metagenome]